MKKSKEEFVLERETKKECMRERERVRKKELVSEREKQRRKEGKKE